MPKRTAYKELHRWLQQNPQFTLSTTGSQHLRITHTPTGKSITTALSPKNRGTAVKMLVRDFKNYHGIVI